MMPTTRPAQRRALRTALAAAALPLLVAGLASCSSAGTGVDGAPASGAGPQDSVEKQARDWDAAYASCMHDAGYESSGPFGSGEASDGDGPDDAELTASDTCFQETVDDRGQRPVSEAEKAQDDALVKEYDRVLECLEEKGVDTGEQQDGVIALPQDVPADISAACGADTFLSGFEAP